MKTAAVVAVIAVVLVAQTYALPPPFVKKCMADNGVSVEDAVKFANSGEASDAMKCNFKCIMMSAGVLKEDGTMELGPMLEHAPEKLHDALKKCVEIEKSADLCDMAYRHNKCLRDNATDFFKEMAKKGSEMMSA